MEIEIIICRFCDHVLNKRFAQHGCCPKCKGRYKTAYTPWYRFSKVDVGVVIG